MLPGNNLKLKCYQDASKDNNKILNSCLSHLANDFLLQEYYKNKIYLQRPKAQFFKVCMKIPISASNTN